MTTLMEELQLCGDWFDLLVDQHALLGQLETWLVDEEQQARILPERGLRLNALRQTRPADVKVVITGQDPYPGLEGIVPHAMGLSFSVARGVKPPRSLNNIYKELQSDIDMTPPAHGDLSRWAEQGVLMLNSTLTLRQGEAASHAKKGWENFTAAVLAAINASKTPVVFLAWGRHSHKLVEKIDEAKHCVVRTSHPSPLGARKSGNGFDAFWGSRCFSKANAYLTSNNRKAVDWDVL